MTDLPENFAEHPKSVAEIKSDRSQDAAEWTPRDCLIDLLRQIDKGEIKPETLVVCWSTIKGTSAEIHYSAAGGNPILAVGTVARALDRMQWRMNGGG